MNILFDATWLSKNKLNTTMHGGLRVTYELAKGLSKSTLVNTNFTLTSLEYPKILNLKQIVSEHFKINKRKVVFNDKLSLRLILSLQKTINTKRGESYIKKNYSFLNSQQLDNYKIYHSPVDPIPDIVRNNKKVRPFLTALDLIPLVKPDFAYPGFYDKLFPIYQSITPDTIVLCISESTKNDLLNYRKDIKEENVVVTYIAADKNIFYRDLDYVKQEPVLKKYGLGKSNYFFTLSALAKFKNIKHTLDCFLNFVQEMKNTEVKLLLVGKSRESNYTVDLFEKYKSHPQIIFLDFLPEDELPIIYSNAIAFLYMSLYEGFGLPILEAMQCGTPVICSNTSSMPEVIGNAGICIDPTDEDLLCDSMNILLNKSEEREKLTSLGLEQAKMFSWDKYTNDVIEAYKKFA